MGLAPVAIVNRNEHGFCAATAFDPSCGTRQDTSDTDHEHRTGPTLYQA
jgi:hypothetical protein